MSDIKTRVVSIIVDKLGVEESEVATEASFYKRSRSRFTGYS